MRKMLDYVVKGNKIFIGLEDSKKTWKLCVRCNRMVIHETGMPAKYEVLQAYLLNRYPDCDIVGVWVVVDRKEGGKERLREKYPDMKLITSLFDKDELCY